MPTDKATEPEVAKSLETGMEGKCPELKHVGASFYQTEDGNAKMAASDLATLLGQVSEISTREIDDLIGELERTSHEARDRLRSPSRNTRN